MNRVSAQAGAELVRAFQRDFMHGLSNSCPWEQEQYKRVKQITMI